MWNTGYAGTCGGGCGCGHEPITKEEKMALLEEREGMLQKKLEYLAKMKEELKSEKPGKEK